MPEQLVDNIKSDSATTLLVASTTCTIHSGSGSRKLLPCPIVMEKFTFPVKK
jgi:hypothetical protein